MKNDKGFTLFETLIGLVVMMLMVTAVTQLFVSNLSSVTFSKARSIGLGLANEQMETLRDLPYDSLATINGPIYPGGSLVDDQFLVRGGYNFKVHTVIKYVDDPYDGVASGPQNGKPQDFYPYDYKKAEITIFLVASNRQVANLTSDFAGKAAETASNTGIISVKVVDANGIAIAGANVQITNSTLVPGVNISTTTDDNGFVIVPKLPPDSGNDYAVTASLPGYSTDGTLNNPGGGQTATKPNLTVLVQQISSVTLSIDRTASMAISVVDTSGLPVPNLALTATSVKTKYMNPNVAKNVYNGTTDGSANLNLTGLEWDGYTFSVPAGYYLVSTQPYAPLAVPPASSASVKLVISTSASYPTIKTAAPISASSSSGNIILQLKGSNFSNGTTLKLSKSGQADVVATSIPSGTTLTSTLNLTNSSTGVWDIVVSNANGTVTQTGGFNVTP